MKRILGTAFAALTLGLGAVSSAGATTLTFEGDICGANVACTNFAAINQGYGDIAAQLDVRYDFDTSDNLADTGMFWWFEDYNDLKNVAYGGQSSTSEIFLQPLNGLSVTLLGFDLGAYPDTSRNSQYTILTGGGTVLASSGTISVGMGPTTHNSYAFNFTSADGIRIQFGPDSYNVGIDNIAYSLNTPGGNAVPEPGVWALMIIGFGATGSMLRARRREAQAA